jgi:hypothetical protein
MGLYLPLSKILGQTQQRLCLSLALGEADETPPQLHSAQILPANLFPRFFHHLELKKVTQSPSIEYRMEQAW